MRGIPRLVILDTGKSYHLDPPSNNHFGWYTPHSLVKISRGDSFRMKCRQLVPRVRIPGSIHYRCLLLGRWCYLCNPFNSDVVVITPKHNITSQDDCSILEAAFHNLTSSILYSTTHSMIYTVYNALGQEYGKRKTHMAVPIEQWHFQHPLRDPPMQKSFRWSEIYSSAPTKALSWRTWSCSHGVSVYAIAMTDDVIYSLRDRIQVCSKRIKAS